MENGQDPCWIVSPATFRKLICLAIIALVLPSLFGCQPSAVKQWELDRQNDSPNVAQLYFALFLAAQDERVYDVAHPDIHQRIEEWMESHEPVCDLRGIPNYVLSPQEMTISCTCDVNIVGMQVGVDSDFSDYLVIKDFESISYQLCIVE